MSITIPPPPPKLEDLRAGTKLRAGLGHSTIIADIDFETYSEAGYYFNPETQKFDPPHGSKVKGLPTIGAAVYARHPSTQVLSLAYDLKDGDGKRLWHPDSTNGWPLDLFEHVVRGGLIEAWNVAFERWIWSYVCVPRMGWPVVDPKQWRCARGKAQAFTLPPGLETAGNVLDIKNKKLKDGRRLLTKFSMPRNPTKHDPRTRVLPSEDPADARLLYEYNLRDIEAEAELSSLIPDLSDFELEFWQCDQAINTRGVQLDLAAIRDCIVVIEQAYRRYDARISELTGGAVPAASELFKMRGWLMRQGVHVDSLDQASITELLTRDDLSSAVREVLQLRELTGLASVKKLYAMVNQATDDGRVHDLFVYHSARTGRAAGSGPQPQNLPNSGPEVRLCTECETHHRTDYEYCPTCGADSTGKPVEWNASAVQDAIDTLGTRSLDLVELQWGTALDTVSACLRGMFVAAPGHDLVCSDYSAIEAVVLAELAGETWRQEVFRTHGQIYEMSASKVTGIPFDEFLLEKATSGKHHPKRKLGKVAELASGYGGWIGAWKNFGADKFMSEEEIKQAILAWRQASPAIVEFWGGQQRNWKPELYGLEGAAVNAINSPGQVFAYRGLSYRVVQDILYCTLPSGRHIVYHRPRLANSSRRPGTLEISYEGWNTNPTQGPTGWIRINTYGGKLTENVVQAVARDILANAVVLLERAGYPVVLHVHDEIVSEVLETWGSLLGFEQIMSTMPAWAAGWPVVAKGGWRAKRYRK
jgi:DNA polymerase